MSETKYLKIGEKKRCSGCTACVAICPKKCITMQADEEGFLYPAVNITACIQCSKCVRVCPYTDSEFTNKPEKNYPSVMRHITRMKRSVISRLREECFVFLPIEL